MEVIVGVVGFVVKVVNLFRDHWLKDGIDDAAAVTFDIMTFSACIASEACGFIGVGSLFEEIKLATIAILYNGKFLVVPSTVGEGAPVEEIRHTVD